MAERPPPPLPDELAAAFDWWRDAGVDCDFAEDATDWLAPPDDQPPAKPAAAPARTATSPLAPPDKPSHAIVASRAVWPTDLAAFREWWLTSDTLDHGGVFPRVAPVGQARRALMVVVNQPEEGDHERLLSGPEGALLHGFLRAAGVEPETVYLASLLPRHDPAPDWPSIRSAGFGDLLAHHIGLAEPQRILLLGRNIPPLLGHDMTQGPAILPEFNQQGRSIPAMGAGGLADMLRSAKRRERFWRCWLDWTYGKRRTD
ncbi:hypothetical protein [Pelagerythrobacter rhizovicinus]|uniref:Uracil-DNA glycosylase-like domain-containing protein n=1 Tax=Pelagerythrobacter rhizovicinus TaxID=2268576 RepID=A0A4Q2KND9_9SPHN|nr:hypothetical protein [Pelagerythrobacter rhizovicinus]RXZ65957.1 hypothetical protein ETX26_04340 [Pelagerythrobacter rhizovicinus]